MAWKDVVLFTGGLLVFFVISAAAVALVVMNSADPSAVSFATLLAVVAFLAVVKAYFQLFVRIWLYLWYGLLWTRSSMPWYVYYPLLPFKVILYCTLNLLSLIPLFTFFLAFVVPDMETSTFYLDKDVGSNVFFMLSGVDTSQIVRNLGKQHNDLERHRKQMEGAGLL